MKQKAIRLTQTTQALTRKRAIFVWVQHILERIETMITRPPWIKYLVTYEINGDRDTDTIYICAHGPQMVKDIMEHYIVRDVIEKGEI